MNRTDARTIIEENARRTLVIRFLKRTTGTLRRMVCIFYPEACGETSFRFNPVEKGLIPVWDLEKGARRFVNLDGVRSIKQGGQRLRVEALPKPEPHRDPSQRRAADREPKTSWEDMEAADREMKYLFGR